MTLLTFTAIDALAALLTTAGLPVPTRNDPALKGFAPAAIDGYGWKLIVNDDGWGQADLELGDPPSWEVSPAAKICMAVEGEAGADRDTIFRGAMQVIAATLFPGGKGATSAGAFEDLRLVSDVQVIQLLPGDAGEPPVIYAEFTVSLMLTAPTPFG